MQIDIQIPRPGLLLLAAFGVSGWMLALSGGDDTVASVTPPEEKIVVQAAVPDIPADTHSHDEVTATAAGGDDTPVAIRYNEAEQRARFAREEQAVLRAKQEILRLQLDELQQERMSLGDQVDEKLEEEFRTSTRLLIELMQDERRAEQFLQVALNQMWEASERARALTDDSHSNGAIALEWPVEPALGISAYFLDSGYERRFKMKHYAIDLPQNQGEDVYAAAGGVIKDVTDHGLGFSYITIEHPGGYSTLYGHLSGFAVEKGQRVYAGDRIGYSGGRPGTPGAGMSTGPHLHFALYRNGAPVDPLQYLPAKAGVSEE